MAKVQFILEADTAKAVMGMLKLVDTLKKTGHAMRKMNGEAQKSSQIFSKKFAASAAEGLQKINKMNRAAKKSSDRLRMAFGGARVGVGLLGSAFKGVANIIKRVFTKAFQIAKRAVLALAAAFAYTVYAFGKFEAAMRRATAVSDVTSEQFAEMSKMARAAAIRLNISAADAARAFYFLGSAGLSAADQIKAFSAVATMAKAATIEMGMAAEMLVDTMKGFGIPFTETGRVTDVLAKAVISSNMTFEQLGETLSMVSGIARQTNNSIEETVAVIAAMADVGIKGSRAGTSLRRSMLNLAAPASTIQKELQKYGIAVYDTTGRMKPFIRIVGEMSEKLRGASEEQKNMAFKTIFGARAIVGQLAVFNKGQQALDHYTKSLIFSGGTSQRIADKQLNSLSEQFGILRKQVTDAAIQLGKLFSPALRGLIDDLKGDVKRATDFFKEHKVVIADWADRVVNAVTLVKDIFLAFVDMMTVDFGGGMKIVFDSFIELLKATFRAAVVLAIAGGKGIWKGVEEGLLGGRDRKIRAETLERYKEKGGEVAWGATTKRNIFGGRKFGETPTNLVKFEEIRKQVEREFLGRQTENIIGESFGVAGDIMVEAFKNIANKTSPETRKKLEKSWQKFQEGMAGFFVPGGGPEGGPGGTGGGAGGGTGGGAGGGTPVDNLVSALRQQLQPREARLLTAAPGARYDFERKTEINTRKSSKYMGVLVNETKKLRETMEKQNRGGTQLQVANLS